jgi:hypothetical protein
MKPIIWRFCTLLSLMEAVTDVGEEGLPCGGKISLGSTRWHEGLGGGLGPVTSQGHPFVGWVGTTGGEGQHEKEADSDPGNPSDSCAICSAHPTFPRTTPLKIGAD